ncbi:MAG: ATP-binding protein [Actinomycetota bacterium]
MIDDHIRVLVIEDNPGDARLVSEMLSETRRLRFHVEIATRLNEGLARLAEGEVDVVLLDLGLPDNRGLEGIVRIHSDAPSVPVVILTISDDEALIRGAVHAGAQGYFVKGEPGPELLARTLWHAIERQRMLGELEQAYEGERISAERLRELDELKSDFISIVSHDLRSPLTTIGGFASTLINRGDSISDDERRKFLEAIERNTWEMDNLIDELLDLARIESGNLGLEIKPFDLLEMIREVAPEMGSAAGRAYTIDAPDDGCPAALGDEGRHRQIFRNLFSNALKFSSPEEPVGVSVVPREAMLEVAVRDRGVGISEEEMPAIFQKFSPARPPVGGKKAGTGLGLYICKFFIEAQGGTIRVESRVGEGSTFTYAVPIAKCSPP